MVASLGAGAIVMLTKSKSHWLYIDFREQNAPKSVVLRMDKNEYKKIFEAVKTHTGKDVEFLGDAKDKKKAKSDTDDGEDGLGGRTGPETRGRRYKLRCKNVLPMERGKR